MMQKSLKVLMIIVGCAFTISLTSCAPEVGSEKWCAALKEKPKGDWSANEAADFTKNCLLK